MWNPLPFALVLTLILLLIWLCYQTIAPKEVYEYELVRLPVSGSQYRTFHAGSSISSQSVDAPPPNYSSFLLEDDARELNDVSVEPIRPSRSQSV